MLRLFHTFITDPLSVIANASEGKELRWLCVLGIVAASLAMEIFVAGSFGSLILRFLVSASMLTIFILIQSLLHDVCAQWFSGKAQSLSLFFFQGVTLLPYALLVPIHMIGKLPVFSDIAFLLKLIIFFCVFFLQIQTLKVRYNLSFIKSLFIYISPLFFVFIAVIIFSLGVWL